MNEDVKTKWVAALRSGNYPQGRNALNKGGAFCCLGVLCEVAVQGGIIPPGEEDYPYTGYIKYGYDTTSPPPLVLRWAGLEYSDTAVGETTLMTLNDEDEAPFDKIADEIERYL